jgi:hypothetical protein
MLVSYLCTKFHMASFDLFILMTITIKFVIFSVVSQYLFSFMKVL